MSPDSLLPIACKARKPIPCRDKISHHYQGHERRGRPEVHSQYLLWQFVCPQSQAGSAQKSTVWTTATATKRETRATESWYRKSVSVRNRLPYEGTQASRAEVLRLRYL